MQSKDNSDNNETDSSQGMSPTNTTSNSTAEQTDKKPWYVRSYRWFKREWSLKGFLEGFAAISVMLAAYIYWSQYTQALDAARSQRSIMRPILKPQDIEHRELYERDHPKVGTHIIQETLHNFGATPAHDVHFDWTWMLQRPDSIPQNVCSWHHLNGSGSIATGDGMSDQIVLSREDREQISKNGRFYVLGRITYRDHFPETSDEIHLTRFCTAVTRMNKSIDHLGWNWVEGCESNSMASLKTLDCTDEDEGCKEEFDSLNAHPKK